MINLTMLSDFSAHEPKETNCYINSESISYLIDCGDCTRVEFNRGSFLAKESCEEILRLMEDK